MPLTIRQTISQMLAQGPWSALELAGDLCLTRREVEEHLEHLGRSLGRRRLDAPGRCPACRGQRIDGPWFQVKP